jgi:GNAT superfamily N-acetyltransferase
MSDEGIQVRTFRFPDDYQVVFELWSNAGDGIHVRRSDELVEINKKLARDPDLFLMAEIEGRVVGTVLGGFDGRRGMMGELERRLQAKGCIRYYLLVTRDNQEAIQFYERRGWVRMDDLYAYGKNLDE